MTDLEDLAEDAAEHEQKSGPTEEELKKISGLIEQQVGLESEVEELERKKKAKQQELNQVRLVDLPQAMNEANCSQFALSDGTIVTVETGIDAHVSKKNQEAAFKWLEDHGFGDLIKRQATVDVGRDEGQARRIQEALEAAGVEPEFNRSVHPQTLKAFVREREREGDVPVPEDTFGVYRYEKAKVESPKSKQ